MEECVWYEWNGPIPTDKEPYQSLQRTVERFAQDSQWGHKFTWHWFFDEPWSPWVVRFFVPQDTLFPSFAGIEGAWHKIDMGSDERDYGSDWGRALALFRAGSEIGLSQAITGAGEPSSKLLYPRKLIHCLMNAWGYRYTEEANAYSEMATRALVLGALEDDLETYNKIAAKLPALTSKRGYFGW